MCPIAAPLLWRAAEALLAAADTSQDLARWLDAAREVELLCDGEQTRLQVTLLCPDKPQGSTESFGRAMAAVQTICPELTGAGAARLDPHSGRALDGFASWGAPGLPYDVAEETYWITRGGFFQVNRFLLPTLIDLVGENRSGVLAWDLFAGVGLFSRVLARNFGAVTAVEANPLASLDLSRALAKIGPQHRAVQATTLDFLRRAVLERERPELIVLDPPRAGAGEDVCRLLARLAPSEIVYLSCDPTTLARDLALLTASGYAITALHLIDLFPQTYHLETLAVLRRA
jgi:23S rRNA (uracil1939-C5)-methyltransferase